MDLTKEELKSWMSKLDGSKKILSLSIPGSHDSCASTGCLRWLHKMAGPWVYTQNYDIKVQLEMGIRYLDIRCRPTKCEGECGGECKIRKCAFAIHHGPYYLDKNFDDVLKLVTTFLNTNKTEVVFMRIKDEHTAESNTCPFSLILKDYYDRPRYKRFFWNPNENGDYNPTLQQCRGKIVIIENFHSNKGELGLKYKNHFHKQDVYRPASDSVKKKEIRDLINLGRNNNRGKINHLSGTVGVAGNNLFILNQKVFVIY
jgi:hypothetical protein